MTTQTEEGSAAVQTALAEYLVGHGKTGGFGRFAPVATLDCQRGDRVVIESRRGLEIGVVLCEATRRHAGLLPESVTGQLLRRATAEDEQALQRLEARGQQLFEEGRRLAVERDLPLEILDVELLFDGQVAILEYLAWGQGEFDPLAEALSRTHGLTVLLESLAGPPAEEEEEHGGCGKPDCGRAEGAEGGGGCTSCGTGGGCSSCGSGKVDITAYFAHLRGKMEERHERTPLL